MQHGFLSADLGMLRQQIVDLPWIDHATLARRSPNQLQISVSEQTPAACWGEAGLLNTRGELFVTDARHVPAELPRLSGPEDQAAAVAKRYLQIREQLIPMGLDVRRLHLDARGAWDMTLQNGVEVTGFTDLAQRYQVSSVPKTVVGEDHEFVGAGPESMLLKHVLEAAAAAGA
jgi:cell division protein FtsQ